MVELEFENELYKILDKYASDWNDTPLDDFEVDRLTYHIKNQLNLINGNITYKEYIELEEIMNF